MIDVTRALRNGHPNWPGDTPFALQATATIAGGSSVNLMSLTTSTHCGTHLDAPLHYLEDGPALGAVPLPLLIGEALVIVTTDTAVIDTREVPPGPLPPRVLFATGQPDVWRRFPTSFATPAPALIRELAGRGVRLIGTDAPSVDRFDSEELPCHAACGALGVAILEGLRLGGVAPGRYRLICLPLHLPDADAAPVRALLLPP